MKLTCLPVKIFHQPPLSPKNRRFPCLESHSQTTPTKKNPNRGPPGSPKKPSFKNKKNHWFLVGGVEPPTHLSHEKNLYTGWLMTGSLFHGV